MISLITFKLRLTLASLWRKTRELCRRRVRWSCHWAVRRLVLLPYEKKGAEAKGSYRLLSERYGMKTAGIHPQTICYPVPSDLRILYHARVLHKKFAGCMEIPKIANYLGINVTGWDYFVRDLPVLIRSLLVTVLLTPTYSNLPSLPLNIPTKSSTSNSVVSTFILAIFIYLYIFSQKRW